MSIVPGAPPGTMGGNSSRRAICARNMRAACPLAARATAADDSITLESERADRRDFRAAAATPPSARAAQRRCRATLPAARAAARDSGPPPPNRSRRVSSVPPSGPPATDAEWLVAPLSSLLLAVLSGRTRLTATALVKRKSV